LFSGVRNGWGLFGFAEDPLDATTLAPSFRFHWWRNGGVRDGFPIEEHVGILSLERAAHVGIERQAADLDAGRCAKPVQHTRPRLAAITRLNKIEVLVTPLVARKLEVGHYRRFCARAGFGFSFEGLRPLRDELFALRLPAAVRRGATAGEAGRLRGGAAGVSGARLRGAPAGASRLR